MKKLYIAIFLILCACNKTEGTSTGNPLVSLQFKSYSALSAESFESQAVSNLKMCFKRLRFKPVDGVGDNIDLALGEVSISTSGTLLTTVSVPAATYTRVEFDLESHCASGKSVQLVNDNGTFESTETMTIRFDGTLNLVNNQNLDLDIQAIITALNSVTANSEIKTKAEFVSGSF